MRRLFVKAGAWVLVVDWFIALRFYRWAHAIQRWTGVTSYQLAAWSALAVMLGSIPRVSDFWVPSVLPNDTSVDVMVALAVSMPSWAYWYYDAMREQRRYEAHPDILPPYLFASHGLQFGIVALRVLMVLMNGVTLYGALRVGSAVSLVEWTLGFGTVTFMYFRFVVPLPPGESKIREWLRGLSAPRLVPIRTEH